jgi:non-heme chloroperoxidase
LPISTLKYAFPVLGNPANRHRAAPLTYDQFRYAFANAMSEDANAVSEDEAEQLYATAAVPASGAPLFPAATADLNPWIEAKVDTDNPDRGPLLIISGEQDRTVPWAIDNAPDKQENDNGGVTGIPEIKNRGHALRSTMDGARSPTPRSRSSSGSSRRVGIGPPRPAPMW